MESRHSLNGETENGSTTSVFFDGCFDMFHYGHANALRSASKMGDRLVVGIHGDRDIRENKREPLFNEEERYRMVSTSRWGDGILQHSSWKTSVEKLLRLGCDFCAHGDDISIAADGTNSYAYLINAGMFKTFPRTEGVSTTDLIERIQRLQNGDLRSVQTKAVDIVQLGHYANYLKHFMEDVLPRNAAESVTGRRPIMNIFERALSLASCKLVSEIVLYVCPILTPTFVRDYKESFATKLGIGYHRISSTIALQTSEIIERVLKIHL